MKPALGGYSKNELRVHIGGENWEVKLGDGCACELLPQSDETEQKEVPPGENVGVDNSGYLGTVEEVVTADKVVEFMRAVAKEFGMEEPVGRLGVSNEWRGSPAVETGKEDVILKFSTSRYERRGRKKYCGKKNSRFLSVERDHSSLKEGSERTGLLGFGGQGEILPLSMAMSRIARWEKVIAYVAKRTKSARQQYSWQGSPFRLSDNSVKAEVRE